MVTRPSLILDSATRARLRLVYPDVAVRWRLVAQDMWLAHGIRLKAHETMRTIAWQAQLYAQGRTTPGKIVTYSKPGDSIHHYGLAIDTIFDGKDPYLERDAKGEFLWKEYGRFAIAHGLTWGGSWSKFVDRPHVQITYGLLLPEIKSLYAYRGLESVWAKCDQMRGLTIGGEWYGPQASVRLLHAGAPVQSSFIV